MRCSALASSLKAVNQLRVVVLQIEVFKVLRGGELPDEPDHAFACRANGQTTGIVSELVRLVLPCDPDDVTFQTDIPPSCEWRRRGP